MDAEEGRLLDAYEPIEKEQCNGLCPPLVPGPRQEVPDEGLPILLHRSVRAHDRLVDSPEVQLPTKPPLHKPGTKSFPRIY